LTVQNFKGVYTPPEDGCSGVEGRGLPALPAAAPATSAGQQRCGRATGLSGRGGRVVSQHPEAAASRGALAARAWRLRNMRDGHGQERSTGLRVTTGALRGYARVREPQTLRLRYCREHLCNNHSAMHILCIAGADGLSTVLRMRVRQASERSQQATEAGGDEHYPGPAPASDLSISNHPQPASPAAGEVPQGKSHGHTACDSSFVATQLFAAHALTPQQSACARSGGEACVSPHDGFTSPSPERSISCVQTPMT
jgi:hypothetical protein